MNRKTYQMDKPITWRRYFKLAGVCTAIGTAISAVYCVMLMKPAWWKATKDFVKRLLRK